MRVLKLLCLLALPILNASCATQPRPLAVVQSAMTGTDRRADIARQLAPLCPVPLSGADLTAAADLLHAHPDAAPVIGRGLQMHKEALICRGART